MESCETLSPVFDPVTSNVNALATIDMKHRTPFSFVPDLASRYGHNINFKGPCPATSTNDQYPQQLFALRCASELPGFPERRPLVLRETQTVKP